MPKIIKEERLKWILSIYKKEVKLIDVSKVCPFRIKGRIIEIRKEKKECVLKIKWDLIIFELLLIYPIHRFHGHSRNQVPKSRNLISMACLLN